MVRTELRRGPEISRERGDEAIEALALNGIGIMGWRRGQLEAAKESYQLALDIHSRRQDQSRAAIVRGNLSLVEQDMGDLAGALKDLGRIACGFAINGR